MVKPPVVGRERRWLSAGQRAAATTEAKYKSVLLELLKH
jgi:hypothetical protein